MSNYTNNYGPSAQHYTYHDAGFVTSNDYNSHLEPVPLRFIHQSSLTGVGMRFGFEELDILSEFTSADPSTNSSSNANANEPKAEDFKEDCKSYQKNFCGDYKHQHHTDVDTINAQTRVEKRGTGIPLAASPHKRAKMAHQTGRDVPETIVVNNSMSYANPNLHQSHLQIQIQKAPQPQLESEPEPEIQEQPEEQQLPPSKIDLWALRVSELHKFITEYGHSVVPHNYNKSPPLAQWVKRQRYQYKLKMDGKHSTLTDERQAELNKLGFVWDSHAAKWEERWTELLEFKAKHGHCNVPITSKDQPQLAIWVKCQRRQYILHQKGQQSSIFTERIERLDRIGFVWNPRQA